MFSMEAVGLSPIADLIALRSGRFLPGGDIPKPLQVLIGKVPVGCLNVQGKQCKKCVGFYHVI